MFRWLPRYGGNLSITDGWIKEIWYVHTVEYCAVLWSATQSCPTLCNPMDCNQASLSMGILQTRILEWVPMRSSRGSSQPRDQTQVSCITGRFFTIWATKKTQEYWSGEPIPSPGDLPDPGIKPGSPALQVDSLPAELPGSPSKYYSVIKRIKFCHLQQHG